MPVRPPAHRLPQALALTIAGLALVACSGGGDGTGAPTPGEPTASASPSPSPTPPPVQPVEGAVTLTALHLEPSGQKLHPPGSERDRAPAVDEGAVEAFVAEVADVLDAHLDALQRGEPTTLTDGLDATASPAALAAVTTSLASPDAPVRVAGYATEVAVDGLLGWALVTITVEHPDGSTASADVVFVPGTGGPELVAAGPAGEVGA